MTFDNVAVAFSLTILTTLVAFLIVILEILNFVFFCKSNAEWLCISIPLNDAFVPNPVNVNVPLPVTPKSMFSLTKREPFIL